MENYHNNGLSTAKIAMISVLIAITAVFTLIIRIPVAPTRGYINFGDVAIFFTASCFGPISALLAGGIGTALADIIGGYPQWAPFTFFAHGLQGLSIGLIIRVFKKEEKMKFSLIGMVLAFFVGTFIMAGIYFLTGGFMFGFAAAATEIPGNIIQNGAGAFIGFPLAWAVYKAYPPIGQYYW